MPLATARRLLRSVEAFLRIDRDGAPEVVTRSRAVYVVAWVLTVLQGINLVAMWHSYGGWSLDATIAVITAAIIFSSVFLLRWTKNFAAFAIFYTGVSVAAVASSAIQNHTGINSALLPYICIGPMIIGYIFDWRAAVVYGAFGVVLLGLLYVWSLVDPNPSGSWHAVATFQRLVQAELSLILGTVVAVNFSYNTYNSLARLQQGLQRARRAEAAKSEFLANMSHELRTPLNGVIGMSEALCAGELSPRDRELAETIRRSGESLLVIIGDLLDLAKIEAGKLVIERRPFDVAGLVRHTLEAWRAAAEAKGLAITAEIEEPLPAASLGDDHRIGQILHNLISNAVKFTDHGAITIRVTTKPSASHPVFVFEVADTGRGVCPEMREQIFEAFEQGEGGTTRRYGGTGLGLPICRLLAELMDGTITLARSGPEGSVFRLALPLAHAEAPARDEPPSGLAPSPILADARVLVAEDNEVNRLVMKEFLKAWGCSYVFAHDGPSALEALEEDSFDLLLLDKHMPGMSGPEVAMAIRTSDAPWAGMPIIAVSADTLAGEREAALAVGMDDYVPKPVRPKILRRAMEQVVIRARRRQAERRIRPRTPDIGEGA